MAGDERPHGRTNKPANDNGDSRPSSFIDTFSYWRIVHAALNESFIRGPALGKAGDKGQEPSGRKKRSIKLPAG